MWRGYQSWHQTASGEPCTHSLMSSGLAGGRLFILTAKPLHHGSLSQPDVYSRGQFDSWFRWRWVWPTFTAVPSTAVTVTRSRRQAKRWPIRGRVTNKFNVPASPTGPSWLQQTLRPTNLGGEDVVGDVPDPLASVDVGVAHAFHFAVDGAHRRVRGLVSLLVDEHPPAKGAESILSGPSVQPTVRRYPGARTHTGDGIRQGFISIPHCNSTRRRRTSVVVNGTRLCNVTVTPCLHPNPPRKGPYRLSLYSCFVIFVLKGIIARILMCLSRSGRAVGNIIVWVVVKNSCVPKIFLFTSIHLKAVNLWSWSLKS